MSGQTQRHNLFGYDLLRRIGQGAGSAVYVARDPATGRQVALKHVVRDSDKAIRFVEQLEAEHEASRDVTHPGLRRTFDLKLRRNLLMKVTEAALVMELFDGQPLGLVRPIDLSQQVKIFLRTA